MFSVSGGMRPIRPARACRRAFTLVELLVVVAIIALLVSILLPTLGKAKALARMVKCSTNLHTIGRAAYMYATEYDDYVPRDAWYNCNDPTSVSFGHYSFAAKFSPYVGGPKIPFKYDDDYVYLYDVFKEIDVYRCPGFQDRQYMLTYLANGRDFTPDAPDLETPAAKLSTLSRAPADVAYICEINPAVLSPSGDFGRYDFFHELHPTFDRNDQPSVFYNRMIRFDDMRHYGRTTMAFFDGHAESRRLIADEMPASMFFPND